MTCWKRAGPAVKARPSSSRSRSARISAPRPSRACRRARACRRRPRAARRGPEPERRAAAGRERRSAAASSPRPGRGRSPRSWRPRSAERRRPPGPVEPASKVQLLGGRPQRAAQRKRREPRRRAAVADGATVSGIAWAGAGRPSPARLARDAVEVSCCAGSSAGRRRARSGRRAGRPVAERGVSPLGSRRARRSGAGKRRARSKASPAAAAAAARRAPPAGREAAGAAARPRLERKASGPISRWPGQPRRSSERQPARERAARAGRRRS